MNLKPCPFCGVVSLDSCSTVFNEDPTYFMTCLECYAEGPTGTTVDEALEAWNRRVNDGV